MTSPTSVPGGLLSAPTNFESRASCCWTRWLEQAVTRVAVHFGVNTVDSNEIVLGLQAHMARRYPGGGGLDLRGAKIKRM
jgi:hypothetical protein